MNLTLSCHWSIEFRYCMVFFYLCHKLHSCQIQSATICCEHCHIVEQRRGKTEMCVCNLSPCNDSQSSSYLWKSETKTTLKKRTWDTEVMGVTSSSGTYFPQWDVMLTKPRHGLSVNLVTEKRIQNPPIVLGDHFIPRWVVFFLRCVLFGWV